MRSDSAFRVLVFGGSAGARRLNQVVPEALARVGRRLAIVHQSGEHDREEVASAYRRLSIDASVHTFLDDMPSRYQWADLVVCRSGATTLAELTAFGVAAVLVPFPFAAGDHQRLNAQALVDAGAAWLILDRDLTAEGLAERVRAAIDEPAPLAELRARARSLGHPEAAARVADECLDVLAARGGEREERSR
jgi:UDP-N-acetylglucosamine--N-acetylmuramyl-(pentapeptide) pyrophosphoryl-undecaprenol N-acetylglucosamine transferase